MESRKKIAVEAGSCMIGFSRHFAIDFNGCIGKELWQVEESEA